MHSPCCMKNDQTYALFTETDESRSGSSFATRCCLTLRCVSRLVAASLVALVFFTAVFSFNSSLTFTPNCALAESALRDPAVRNSALGEVGSQRTTRAQATEAQASDTNIAVAQASSGRPSAGGQVLDVSSARSLGNTQTGSSSGSSVSNSYSASSSASYTVAFSGQPQNSAVPVVRGDFRVPPGLEGKVEFWKLIFTKYGQQQYVFHHRDYPEIIYSVLDLSAIAQASPGTPVPKTGELVADEIQRIRTGLRNLGEGNKPRDPFERRLKRLFVRLEQSGGSKVYATASEDEKIRYQQGIQEKFIESIRRSGRYLHAMERVFRERGLPVELTRVPFIESSFDYTAYSSVGAAGIWQFMRSTGKKYMRINATVDERKDPIAATYAAAEYLRSAYSRLESWPLAVTSYNHGVGGMMRGVQEVGSRDLPVLIDKYSSGSFGFASKNFYAEFLAALQIERNVEKYFPGLERESPWYFEEVVPGKSLTLAEVVRYAECSREDVERLNRSLLSPVLSGRGRIPGDMVLRLPMGAGKRLQAHLKGSAVVGIVEPPKPKPEKERKSRASSTRSHAKQSAAHSPAVSRPAVSSPAVSASVSAKTATKHASAKEVHSKKSGKSQKSARPPVESGKKKKKR